MTNDAKTTIINVPLYQEEIGDLLWCHLKAADEIEATNIEPGQTDYHVWYDRNYHLDRVSTLDQHLTGEIRSQIVKQRAEHWKQLSDKYGLTEESEAFYG
jgi:hypothetical protein